MEDSPKQDAHKPGGETERDNFSAEEVAGQSAYENSTEVAQQMRRADAETKAEGDERDEVGASKLEDWDQRQIDDGEIVKP